MNYAKLATVLKSAFGFVTAKRNPLTGEMALNAGGATFKLVQASAFGILPNTGSDLTALFADMFAKLPAGSMVQLDAGVYMADIIFAKDNTRLVGAGTPSWSGGAFASGATVLAGGTIITPPPATASVVSINLNRKKGCEVGFLGIDQSTGPNTLLNGLIDGFGPTAQYRGDNYIHDLALVGRGYATNNSQHGVLVSCSTDNEIKNIKGYRFGHTIAVKQPKQSIETIVSYDAELSSVIVKADANDSNAHVYSVNVNDVIAECTGSVALASNTINIQTASQRFTCYDVNVSNVSSRGHLATATLPIQVWWPSNPTYAYSQTASTTVAVTLASHGLQNGDTFPILVSSGTLASGNYTVSGASTNTFNITSAVSTTTSGNFTIDNLYNISFTNIKVKSSVGGRAFGFEGGRNITVVNAHVADQGGYSFRNVGATGVKLIGCTSVRPTTADYLGTFEIAEINGYLVAAQKWAGATIGSSGAGAFGVATNDGYVSLYRWSGVAGQYFSYRLATASGKSNYQVAPTQAAIGSESYTLTGWSVDTAGLFYPPQFATPPAWSAGIKGAVIFDTTANKLKVAGNTAWETITSA